MVYDSCVFYSRLTRDLKSCRGDSRGLIVKEGSDAPTVQNAQVADVAHPRTTVSAVRIVRGRVAAGMSLVTESTSAGTMYVIH